MSHFRSHSSFVRLSSSALSSLALVCLLGGPAQLCGQAPAFKDRLRAYWQHQPQDQCTKLLEAVAVKKVRLNTTSQHALMRSLLTALNVPASSQLLVYSGTASQGTRVRPTNPRALYFNDDVYVGMVPGGFVEVVGVDPEFGCVLYSFESMKAGAVPEATRSEDCMRCHAVSASGGLPGMLARSLAPIATGGVGETFHRDPAGHEIPLVNRFGGWHVTSTKPFGPTMEGTVAERVGSTVKLSHIKAGQLYDSSKYLARTSDILAHLVHEHQLGFINCMTNLLCAAREAGGSPVEGRFDAAVDKVLRYVLFADEAELPAGGITGDARFIKDFSANRKPSKSGAALKDLDLGKRMFKYRCSYMIYTAQWQQMPPMVKTRMYERLKLALSGKDSNFDYIPTEERAAIIAILRDTVPNLPADWR